MSTSAQAPDPVQLRAFRAAIRTKIERDLERERDASVALRAQVLPAVKRGLAEARVEGLCARAWLFGSFAWGDPGARSDVDLIVEGCADPFLLAAVVGRACERDVHVIPLEAAPESLRRRALAEGTAL